MRKFDNGEINVAVVATPSGPVGETGGAEVFTGSLANALATQGFPVSVYGQEDPTFNFTDGVRYVPTGPSSDALIKHGGVGLRKAVNETGVALSLGVAARLAMDCADGLWVVIDNDITSAPLVPLLHDRVPFAYVQHSAMTTHTHDIYSKIRAYGGRIIAIADHQRDAVTKKFGELHDVTIKNGIRIQDLETIQPAVYQHGEPIRVGTLSRIEATDMKGIGLATEAVRKLRELHEASLTVAGPVASRGTYEAVIAPILGSHVIYAGEKSGVDKAAYLANLHVGAALSNPGNWDDVNRRFTANAVEGNSLTLHEMVYSATVPVSSDSGGAEPLVDMGLGEFVVPLGMIEREGVDSFTTFVAKKMLEAAYYPDPSRLRDQVRTMDDTGKEYATYIHSLVNSVGRRALLTV